PVPAAPPPPVPAAPPPPVTAASPVAPALPVVPPRPAPASPPPRAPLHALARSAAQNSPQSRRMRPKLRLRRETGHKILAVPGQPPQRRGRRAFDPHGLSPAGLAATDTCQRSAPVGARGKRSGQRPSVRRTRRRAPR